MVQKWERVRISRFHVAAGSLLRREADERMGLVDGAVWIREQMEFHFAELDALGLDFYHLSENVHRARRTFSAKSIPKGGHGPTS